MNTRILLLLILSVAFSSCSSVYYISDHMNIDSDKIYKTYMTEDHCDKSITPIQAQRIKNAVDLNMRSLGYVETETADILVQYFVKNTTKEYVQECENDYDRWTGGETCREMVITYEEGSIIIDLIDTDNNTIIWHGAARGPSFNAMRKPDKDINQMVGKLLEFYVEGESNLN